MSHNRAVLYTAVFGDYDDPPRVHQADPEVDYIFFTDNPDVEVPPPWQRRVLPAIFNDPQRCARHVKILPHEFLPEYDVSVWMDANCELLELTSSAIENMLGDADIALPLHQHRHCVFDEAEAVLALKLDSPDRVTTQIAAYTAAGFPRQHGLHATMFLMRRHNNSSCRQFCVDWWEQVQRYSKRDQLSFDFVRWKSKANASTLPISYLQNSIFHWPGKHKLPARQAPQQPMNIEQPTERTKIQLAAKGFAEPFNVFSENECAWLLRNLEADTHEPADWFKGHAVTSRAFYDAAVDWRILSHVCAMLGEDVILWGASLVRRDPGQQHPWHSDIECSANSQPMVSVWIGLSGTQPETSLKVVPGSHRFGLTAQEKASQKGKQRDEVQESDITEWARECGAAETPRLVPMRDGEALFFDGKLWHGSSNVSPALSRTALLLQYATPDTPIRIPEIGRCEWPFRFLDSPRPRCLLVTGRDRTGVNRISPPPMLQGAAEGRRLHCSVHPPQLLPERDVVPGWAPSFLFRGHTAALSDITCHLSVLNHGKCPHPPLQHPEEEILLVLSGQVDVFLPRICDQPHATCRRLCPGQFVYFPAGQYHTLTTISQEPASYMMLRWFSDPTAESPPLEQFMHSASDLVESDATRGTGFSHWVLCDEPTSYLSKLYCHATLLEPGVRNPVHIDDHDVIVVVLEGEVEALGQRVPSHGVIFLVAGEPHAVSNPGDLPARYLVFELHGGKMAARHLREEASRQAAS